MRTDDVRYSLRADYSYETYNMRRHLKNIGAMWVNDGWKGYWEVTEAQLAQLPRVQKVIWIEAETHTCGDTQPHITFVPESKAVEGTFVDCFCGYCDSHYNGKILRVIGEQRETSRRL